MENKRKYYRLKLQRRPLNQTKVFAKKRTWKLKQLLAVFRKSNKPTSQNNTTVSTISSAHDFTVGYGIVVSIPGVVKIKNSVFSSKLLFWLIDELITMQDIKNKIFFTDSSTNSLELKRKAEIKGMEKIVCLLKAAFTLFPTVKYDIKLLTGPENWLMWQGVVWNISRTELSELKNTIQTGIMTLLNQATQSYIDAVSTRPVLCVYRTAFVGTSQTPELVAVNVAKARHELTLTQGMQNVSPLCNATPMGFDKTTVCNHHGTERLTSVLGERMSWCLRCSKFKHPVYVNGISLIDILSANYNNITQTQTCCASYDRLTTLLLTYSSHNKIMTAARIQQGLQNGTFVSNTIINTPC